MEVSLVADGPSMYTVVQEVNLECEKTTFESYGNRKSPWCYLHALKPS